MRTPSLPTGRLREPLAGVISRMLFTESDAVRAAELRLITDVDRAHLLMLARTGLVPSTRVRRTLREISRLRGVQFAPLRECPAPRGLYWLYEGYLCETLGAECGGVLQTARSRNDLNATLFRLRLRRPVRALVLSALRLTRVLIDGAERHREVVMPAYTHFQVAVPITYGHFLAGVAGALLRDLRSVLHASEDIDRCPLGAGAVGGATLPIDTALTARLLGFAETADNSVDAVASRDAALHLLAAAGILGVTLSRVATDLLLWTTAEFGFLELPDRLVGVSSLMPQKRNPFILEHAQARGAGAIGAFVAAALAMECKPFTNSIAVGTEATKDTAASLQAVAETADLIRVAIAAATPNPQRMRERAIEGRTCATELANRLMGDGRSFREAHRLVSARVRELEDGVRHGGGAAVADDPLAGIDPGAVVAAAEYGGGPGPAAARQCAIGLRRRWRECAAVAQTFWRRWRTAARNLDACVTAFCTAR